MSGVFNAAGTRLTKAGVTTSTTGLDPEVRLEMDLYDRQSYGRTDPKVEGSIPRLLYAAKTVLRQSTLNQLFAPGKVDGIAPASGPLAGGTVVTIFGSELDGITAVTFAGVAGTAITIVNDREVKVTAPAQPAGVVAGPKDVVITDDGSTITLTGRFTYV